MRKIVLIRFINALASKQEEEDILRWLKTSAENRRYFDYLKSIWVLSALPEERADETEYSKFTSRFPIRKNKKKNVFYFSLATIAAAILFLFFALKPYIVPNNIKDSNILISNNYSDIQYYNLPDSTRIALFPNAEIYYNRTNFTHKRVLTLKGKAFFEVINNNNKAFHVYTADNIDIKVTGTKFFINSTNKFEAFLKEGKISIKKSKGNKEIHMNPGDMVIIDSNMELVKIPNAPTPEDFNLLNSYFCFENAIMRDVLHKLENYHKVTFICKKNNIKDFLFTGDLNNETIESILALFHHSMGIQYSIKNRDITLY